MRASLAVTAGVETPADGAKSIAVGADAVQLVSAIVRHGPAYFQNMREGLTAWAERLKVRTLDDMRGCLSLKTFEVVNALTFDPSM